MADPFGLSGRRVVLTGGSSGIGLGLAKAIAATGARLTVLALPDGIEALDSIGDKASILACDITDRDAVAAAMSKVGDIDVLIANAGLERLTPVDDCSDEASDTFAKVLAVNVTGTWNTAQAALPQMNPGGVILMTASVWGRTGEAGFAAYVASKHAVIGLARTLARELGPRDIRVNAVCPGWVETPASLRSLAEMAARQGRSEAEILAAVSQSQCLPGFQKPEDIAGLYLYLASPHAASITGQAIGIDRGEFLA